MFKAICRHCDETLFVDVPRLEELQYTAMRLHLSRDCRRMKLDLDRESVGELLKEYLVTLADRGQSQ
jgi:hypothetical protein